MRDSFCFFIFFCYQFSSILFGSSLNQNMFIYISFINLFYLFLLKTWCFKNFKSSLFFSSSPPCTMVKKMSLVHCILLASHYTWHLSSSPSLSWSCCKSVSLRSLQHQRRWMQELDKHSMACCHLPKFDFPPCSTHYVGWITAHVTSRFLSLWTHFEHETDWGKDMFFFFSRGSLSFLFF